MSAEVKVFANTKCIDIGGRYYCIYCRGEVTPDRDYKYEHEDNYGFPCSCIGALENAHLEKEAEEIEQSLKRLRELQARIPNFTKELMVLQEEERANELQRQLDQAALLFSFREGSLQPDSTKE